MSLSTLPRAEQAKAAFNAVCMLPAPLLTEQQFASAEDEYFASQQALKAELQALGVDPERIVGVLS